jgi:hypothetical protein
MRKAITNYRGLNEMAITGRAREVYSSMTKNPNFPAPNPSMPDFLTLINSCEDAVTASKTGDKTAVAKKNGLLEILVVTLRDLASYVNSIALGNMEILAGCGFDISKEREPSKLTVPEITSIVCSDIAGVMIIKVKKDKAAGSYLFQAALSATASEGEWKTVGCNASRCEMTGLVQGKKYWFRVIAIGSRGQQACSQATPRYVNQYVMDSAS